MDKPKPVETKPGRPVDYAALIGIDWGSEAHTVCLVDTATGEQRIQELKQTPETLLEWVASLRQGYHGAPVAVCLEQSRGPLIYALMGQEFLTLYPINPKTLAKYREAFKTSGAKDDPGDATLLAEILGKHRDKLVAWEPDDEQTRTLALLNEGRRRTVDLRSQLVVRLQAALRNYFPQALELLGGNVSSELACAFLLKWPTLIAIQAAKPKTVRAFYYAHNYRRADLIQKHLDRIRAAQPLTQDTAIVTASVTGVQILATQVRALNRGIETYEKEIAALYAKHPDRMIFDSLPAAGPALGPRLLSALGTNRDRYQDASQVQAYSGIAPVVERSGKQLWVHWRWRCPTFVRQTYHEHANCSRRASVWAAAYYQMQRERGQGHHAAIRALAFKWQRIIFRCWKERKPYDEDRYLRSLQAAGSPLWQRIQDAQKPLKKTA